MRIHIKLLTLLIALVMLLQASATTILALEPIYVDTGIHQAFTGYMPWANVHALACTEATDWQVTR